MLRAHIAGLCIAGLAIASTGDALARPEKVAVVGVEIGGDGAPELRPQLVESIAAGLREAGVKTVELDAVQRALEGSPELLGCLSSTCLARIGELTGADGFVRAKVSADGADYTLELELYDRDQLVNKLELPCSVCTIGELNQVARVTTEKLLAHVPEKPVQVVIRSDPAGAKLTIDGVSRGSAPFEGPLAPGPHDIIAQVEGVGRVERRVVITESSSTEPIVVQVGPLRGSDGADPAVLPRANYLGTLKWVTGGASVVALGTGALLIALDGRGTCDRPGRECQRELNTSLAGWITAGGGLALAVAAGWMFWADHHSERERHAAVVPIRDGAVAVFSTRF